jgi:hypothetical protein
MTWWEVVLAVVAANIALNGLFLWWMWRHDRT